MGSCLEGDLEEGGCAAVNAQPAASTIAALHMSPQRQRHIDADTLGGGGASADAR